MGQPIVGYYQTGGGGYIPMPTTWYYSPADPWALRVLFNNEIEWCFGRSLVVDGLQAQAPVGLGDVTCWRDEWKLHLTLSSPSGRAEFAFDVEVIEAFLWKTYEQCPLGEEDERARITDALLVALLDEEW